MSTAIKESSTNQLNKKAALNKCPVTITLEKIGARWKPLILWQLINGAKRYNELRKALPHITEKMLIQHLRELESDKLVVRIVQPVVPPHVEYKLSESGKSLSPVLYAMAQWGMKNGWKRPEK
jgi:DNA-binding HxlR family transcriptional regulator